MNPEIVMVDTSVWIDFFRNGNSKASEDLSSLIEHDLVCICGIVELEIIQGLKENEKGIVLSALDVVNYIEITRQDYKLAGNLINKLRKNGITVPSSDAIIAACSINNDFKLLTFDKDFIHFKQLRKLIYKL